MILKRVKNGEEWLRFLCKEFSLRGRPHIVNLLRYASLESHIFEEGINCEETLILWVRWKEWARMPIFSAQDVKGSVEGIARLYGVYDSKVVVYPPDEEPFAPLIEVENIGVEEDIGLNNCFFKTETIIEHDGLRFRSPAEIPIYKELKKRQLLFFPNAAAVLGVSGLKREPDFLICLKGRWGILEVMGKEHHNETTAVKDHERARLFKEHGIMCIEFFPGGRCLFNPSGVVDEFLKILASY